MDISNFYMISKLDQLRLNCESYPHRVLNTFRESPFESTKLKNGSNKYLLDFSNFDFVTVLVITSAAPAVVVK